MARLLFHDSRIGVLFDRNYDRSVVDEDVPLFAVIDSECDDGTTGEMVAAALRAARPKLRAAMDVGADDVESVLVGALQTAKERILSIPKGAPGYAGGSSVTAVACAGDVAVVAHVGDCRLYVQERDGWVRKTRDHTLLEDGRLPALPAALAGLDESMFRAVITRVVGVVSNLEVDTLRLPLNQGSTLLLCTRGAWLPLDPAGAAKPLPGALDAAQIAAYVMDSYVRD